MLTLTLPLEKSEERNLFEFDLRCRKREPFDVKGEGWATNVYEEE